MARKRVIYQSEALYVAATGNGAVASKLSRVQNINYGFDIPRQDVNEFGKLARIDQVILESPTVSLDYSYYITTGKNEDIIGFAVTGGVSAMTNMLNGSEDVKNYYIATVPEGIDEIGHNRYTTPLSGAGATAQQAGVIGLGNMSMTSYSVEASVGGFPTASVNCEGLNIRFENTNTGTAPTVNQVDGTSVGDSYELEGDQGTTGDAAKWTPSALRPGDVSLVFDDNTDDTMMRGVDLSELKLQSANISVDLGREDLLRLGNKFAFSKEVDYPVTVSMTAEAMLSDTREFDLSAIICSDTGKYEAYIKINMPQCSGTAEAIRFTIKGAQLDSEAISSSIGDNKQISFNFTSQVGGPNDTDAGLFILPPQTVVTP
jgi:hypothetical protein